jgi:arylsulfatase A-like enzyme
MLRDSYKPWGEGECLDVFTHHAAMEELKKTQPRVLYIAYGETDEWAHAGKYRSYLDAARQVDAWIKEIWDYVQSTPQYKNKTALLITTDHGRGDKLKEQWTDHGSDIVGANEIWLAVMAPGIKPMGEAGAHGMLYQQQIAQTIARLLGQKFTANHPVAESISPVFNK